MALDYFYDGQMRQYIVQIIRAFSGFQVTFGKNEDGTPKFRVVPVLWATQDRQVAAIINNNSENTALSAPQMSCFITQMEIASDRRQAPNHVDTRHVVEREIDTISNKYLETRGKSYTVERFMPVPYNLTIQLDIWTTNQTQKQQILEQLLVLFNPSIDLQANVNALDWTSLTSMELKTIMWTSRSIPIGTSTELEISSLTFALPIWLNPPAKVQRQRIIEQIITNITSMDSIDIDANLDPDAAAQNWSRGDVMQRSIVTPGNHCIRVEGNTITLLGANGSPYDSEGKPYSFFYLFDEYYDRYVPGVSRLRLKTNDNLDDVESDIVGVIQIDEEEPNKIHFTVDVTTLPSNTLPAIDGIIDPLVSWPVGPTTTLAPKNPMPPLIVGQRYMIINDIGSPGNKTVAWGEFHAQANDIIEYLGNNLWAVAFDASETKTQHTLLNKKSGKQITWLNGQWVVTLAGVYQPGMWRVAL